LFPGNKIFSAVRLRCGQIFEILNVKFEISMVEAVPDLVAMSREGMAIIAVAADWCPPPYNTKSRWAVCQSRLVKPRQGMVLTQEAKLGLQ
jgi:hypothetical protein